MGDRSLEGGTAYQKPGYRRAMEKGKEKRCPKSVGMGSQYDYSHGKMMLSVWIKGNKEGRKENPQQGSKTKQFEGKKE